MAKQFLAFQQVSFSYDSMATDLFSDISFQLDHGWTGIVGSNGSGKTTLMQLAVGECLPTKGQVIIPDHYSYCSQRTDLPPESFQMFLEDSQKDAYILRSMHGIKENWLLNWEKLSHGERKRSQIASALWQKPSFLAIDEPTNHLDRSAKVALMKSLKQFPGMGLLISHDRELLDELCHQLIFVEPPGVDIRKGRLEDAQHQKEVEEKLVLKEQERVKKEVKKLKRKADHYRKEASRSHEKRSKKGISKKDHDAKAKINAARVSGKDGVDGKLLNSIQGRVQQVNSKLENLKIIKHYEMGIMQDGSVMQQNSICSMEEGLLDMGRNVLQFPNLEILPDSRISLTGDNGSGKSTLIQYLVKKMNHLKEKVLYIPQEINIEQSVRIFEEVKDLSKEKLGEIMTIVSRLGTRPARLLESELPSPGEIRKILLALGIIKSPGLIIMDEPTNHLDLPSIQCLESSLQEYPAALLLVSHDRHFLEKLVNIEWYICRTLEDERVFQLKVT